jgi:pre-rRNA-processing protein IPI3
VFFFLITSTPYLADLSNTDGGTLRQATHDSVTTYEREELLRDWEFFVKPRPATTMEHDAYSTPRPDGRVTELEDEVARLKSQLARAKGINDVMWESLTQTAAAQGKELAAPDQVFDSHEDAADVRERKRGKTKA